MAAPRCCFIESGFLCPEEIQRLNAFFSEDLALGVSAKWEARISRSGSGSLSEKDGFRGCDAERSVGADEWDPFDEEEKEQPPREQNEWLRKVDLQAYSNLDFIMAVHRHRIGLLTKNTSTSIYQIALLLTPSFLREDAEITCAAAFGLGSSRKTERLDCVCIAVGTTEGQVAFYTEKGTLLFLERFANVPILDVSFEQFTDEQQISVSTENDVFLIQPFSLVSVLSQAKTAIAMGQQTAQELSDTLEIEVERIEPENGGNFGSVVITGTQKPPSFDQYVTASTQDFSRRVDRPGLPNYATIFITRPDKYLGDFVWHETGQKTGAWGAAVNQVANKVIPHFGLRKFLGWAKDDTRKTWAVARSKMTAYTRGTLGESRIAEWLVRAPDRSLIAVVDNHARVLLIDYNSRQIVRIWKGYRDARCLFVTSRQNEKSTLFLVIHAPRRDLIEIWCLQNGYRVSARHVPPNSLLLDGGGEMVVGGGLAEITSSAFLLLPDGRILSIEVPFICALIRTSNEDHDKLYLGKLSEEVYQDVQIFCHTFINLKTIRGRRELVTNLMNSVDSAKKLLRFVEALEKIESSISINELLISIHRLCTIYEKMMNWEIVDRPMKRDFLKLSPTREFKCLFSSHIDWESDHIERKASNFSEFVAIVNSQIASNSSQIRKLSDEEVTSFTQLIFNGFIYGGKKISSIFELIDELPFNKETFPWLVSQLWSHRSNIPTNRETLALLLLVNFFIKSLPTTHEIFEKSLIECENINRSIVLYGILIMIQLAKKPEIFEDFEKELRGETIKEMRNDVNIVNEDLEGKEVFDETDNLPPIELEVGEKENLMNESSEEDETRDWETMLVQNETVNSWLHAGHVLNLLERLDDPIEKQSFGKLFSTGIGYFSEQVAKYILNHQFEPETLNSLTEDQESPLFDLFQELPNSLELDRLKCEATWDALSSWIKNKEIIHILQQFGVYLSSIKCDRLRHGISRLVWETHLGEIFRETAQLFDKTGRSPKDREARKHIGVSDIQLPIFLETCLLCLRELLSSVRDSPPPLQIEYEDWLKTAFSNPPIHSITITTRASLCETISKQGLVNYHLVLHHLHLAIVLLLQSEPIERCHVMRHLFCEKGQRAFFLPFTSHPLIPLAKVDESLQERRHLWIERMSENLSEASIPLARELCSEWNLGSNDMIVGMSTRLLREGRDTDAGREISHLTHTERIATKMCQIMAARVLKLSAEKASIIQQATERQLRVLAGDEVNRVMLIDESDRWESSIHSLGHLAASIHLPDLIARDFKEINSICLQNFSIRFW